MAALVTYYLGIKCQLEPDDDMLITSEEYDKYAGNHIFEQIKKLRNHPEVGYKCFCLMADYSDLKYRLESDIDGVCSALNDTVVRILGYIEEMSTPEALKAAMDGFSTNQNLLDAYLKERPTPEEIARTARETNEEDKTAGEEE